MRPAILIDAANLAIENGAFDAEVLSNPRRKLRESREKRSRFSKSIRPVRLEYVQAL